MAGMPVTPDISPFLRPSKMLLAMIIMTMGPDVSVRTTTWPRIHPEAVNDESRPPPRSHRSFFFCPPPWRLASGWDQAGWRQSQPTVEEPSTTHQPAPLLRLLACRRR